MLVGWFYGLSGFVVLKSPHSPKYIVSVYFTLMGNELFNVLVGFCLIFFFFQIKKKKQPNNLDSCTNLLWLIAIFFSLSENAYGLQH